MKGAGSGYKKFISHCSCSYVYISTYDLCVCAEKFNMLALIQNHKNKMPFWL